MKNLKIGYFADGQWSHQALERILNDETLSVSFICARHDRPDPILEKEAEKNSIDFITHPKINSDEFLQIVSSYHADIFVSMSFNQIFKKRIINTPPLKSINCHAGKLPFYRGRNILNWALINDESEFGVTIHYIDEGIDTGDIILQHCYSISDNDDYQSLLARSYKYCSDDLYEAIKLIQKDEVKLIKQTDINPFGFYCTMRQVGDEIIDWNQSSRQLFNFIRAICRPGPEARTYLHKHEIKINKSEYFPDTPKYKGIPGSIVGIDSHGFFVKTLDSVIKITEWSGYDKPRIGDRLA